MLTCSFSLKQDWLGMELEPGLNELPAEVEVYQAGEFGGQLTLWVDDAGLREITFTVHGRASKPAEPSADAKESTK